MSLILYNEELLELMRDFYTLTDIRLVLYDKNDTEILSYPKTEVSYCGYMRQNKDFIEKCNICDKEYENKCRKEKRLIVYKCHAGLTEAIAPLKDGDEVFGYMRFGQLANINDKESYRKNLAELYSKYGFDEDLQIMLDAVKYKSTEQIYAASKILEAITGYILLKQMVRRQKENLLIKIEGFIDAHIGEKITVDRLCKEFGVSRTRLYEQTSAIGGIASFIKRKKLIAAKDLIANHNRSISEAAELAGFDDYNYFLRIFKKEFGITPKSLKTQ